MREGVTTEGIDHSSHAQERGFQARELKIALIAPPFIAVPPADYGGTELFVAHLADGLLQLGLEVVVYSNGESTVHTDRRWIYDHSEWPIKNPSHAFLKCLNHESWAIHEAAAHCEVIHVPTAWGRRAGSPDQVRSDAFSHQVLIR